MASRHAIPFMRKITTTQDMIDTNLVRVKELETALKNKQPSEHKKKLQAELAEIREEILKKETELKQCYGENRKTFMVAVLVMFFSFLIYVVYIMIVGPNANVKPISLNF
ncbi:uncharacterized protein LOC106663508 [Cimex lectularius]|uniref:Coiled-coil domain-containing protein 167 n=1 Tax=Cimex lectularius TaxID=79782 RepID=A0A8I6RKN1_CIMLE|nr:uncharacterized protein LOC106663508 [Cimex lectularius]